MMVVIAVRSSEDSDESGRVVVMTVVIVAWAPLMRPLHLYNCLPAISITVPKVSMVMITTLAAAVVAGGSGEGRNGGMELG